jgi:hypothetical protein
VDVTPDALPSTTTTLAAAAPTIVTACVSERTARTIAIRVTGISNTREIRTAVFHFAPSSPASQLTAADLSPTGLDTLFAGFYNANNGPFVYDQGFNVSGSVDDIGIPTVSISNAIGASTTVQALACQ